MSSTEMEGALVPPEERQPKSPSMKYWGGFFDETLNFDVDAYPKPTVSTPNNIVYQPALSVSSSDRSKLEFVQHYLPDQVGSRINPEYKDPDQREHDRWELKIGDALSCFRFLQWVKPFLEHRQTQAVVFDEFLQQKREVIRVVDGLTRVTRLYPTPMDRMEVEEDFRERLIKAKSQVSDMPLLPEPERLAGIFDASGSFGVYGTIRLPSGRTEYNANCQIISMQQSLLNALYAEYRGAKPTEYSAGLNRHGGQSWMWQVSGYEVGRLLSDIEPYLVRRKTAARFTIDFLRVKRAFLGTNYIDDSTIRVKRSEVLGSYEIDLKTLGNTKSNS